MSQSDLGARSVPRLLIVPAVVGVLFLLMPLVALVAKADWPALPAAITSQTSRQALWLSLRCGVAATVLCLILGVPMAMLMARSGGRWVVLLRGLTTLPLVLPPMVGGIALLYLLGRGGLIGHYMLTTIGQIPFTTTAVVIAEAFVSLPFLVLSLEGSLRTAGTRFEVVAATLGAGRWTVFRRVTLPLVGPGLISATVLCFARALGEFGATALFAGNYPGITQTMPLAIYEAFNGAGVDQDSAIAMSLLLVLVSAVILVLIRPWRFPGIR
ncbi:molybdate transport system permease protein [Nakamurella panacisegetis]|uniref:Molybdenum transport system permease n=1 Tax=Nakamurella panacisegetis TaxID=1090615 RepID=A0A1H0J522_9ACTN|nr:ABC transporter permease [Nakamurella panacisegetis]SDO38827.1 molybdate transport system permease protein [Nakamurella panacisegetis]